MLVLTRKEKETIYLGSSATLPFPNAAQPVRPQLDKVIHMNILIVNQYDVSIRVKGPPEYRVVFAEARTTYLQWSRSMSTDQRAGDGAFTLRAGETFYIGHSRYVADCSKNRVLLSAIPEAIACDIVSIGHGRLKIGITCDTSNVIVRAELYGQQYRLPSLTQ